MYARARWGVFGTYNTNKILLTDCDINRFDVHCYGKDIKSIRCRYSNLYNQFSSVYGKAEFYDCEFCDFVPVLLESSFNAYTPFDVIFKGCTFNMGKKKNFIITLSGLEERHNSRPELSRKAIPNIIMIDCIVNLPDGIKQWYVIDTGKVKYKESLDYMNYIKIKNLLVNSLENFSFDFFSIPIRCSNTIELLADKVYISKCNKMKNKYKMKSSNMSNSAIIVVNDIRICE